MPDNEPIIPKYMNLYKRIEYNGHHIDIYYDESPESPRAWDNLGTFYTIHHRYCPEEEFDRHFQWEEVFDRYGDFSDSFEKQYIALKIYLYDHSGQTISSSPFFYPWDSGLFGIVAVSVEKVKEGIRLKLLTADRRRKIEGYLQGRNRHLRQLPPGRGVRLPDYPRPTTRTTCSKAAGGTSGIPASNNSKTNAGLSLTAISPNRKNKSTKSVCASSGRACVPRIGAQLIPKR